MTEYQNFDPLTPRARLADPDTSKEAAREIDGYSVAAKVARAIGEHGEAGANNAELTRDLKEFNIPNNSINSTCSRLHSAGYIEDSGERRDGDYGKSQIVWKVRQVRQTVAEIMAELE